MTGNAVITDAKCFPARHVTEPLSAIDRILKICQRIAKMLGSEATGQA